MNRIIDRKKFVFAIVVLFAVMAIAPGFVSSETEDMQHNYNEKTITFNQKFSSPEIVERNQDIFVELKEADSFTTMQGGPKLPAYTKTFEFAFGAEISNIEFELSEITSVTLSKKIEPSISFQQKNDNYITYEQNKNHLIYNNNNLYPSNWYTCSKGTGINQNGDHVLYLSIHVYPVRYNPVENLMQTIDSIDISIIYEEKEIEAVNCNLYDLVVITPLEFKDNLIPLVEHKNRHDLKTKLVTLDYIYETFSGRDEAEQIKYFVKYALDEWGIEYVLLIGDVTKLPIRTTYSHFWTERNGTVLSDLYYADIYDEDYKFCTWDFNENDMFGEVDYSGSFHNIDDIQLGNIDNVDLYPDVKIGRIPCTNKNELDIVINKIITYENKTYNNIWFKKIVLAGGDTFPLGRFGTPFVYEGEITNTKVSQELPDFEHIKLWATKRNLNAVTFNRAINKGAGFVTYAGHGFEFGWGTYRPNAIREKIGITQPLYYTPFVDLLKNKERLPIIFFDACLTATLDFTFEDFIHYDAWSVFEILTLLPTISKDMMLPTFAWVFLKKENGGAIATIGATRSAYTMVDTDGVHAGAGYLDVHFFKAYEEGITLGQMFVQAKNDYINNVGTDFFTIEEFVLLGDPSLMVGGYP